MATADWCLQSVLLIWLQISEKNPGMVSMPWWRHQMETFSKWNHCPRYWPFVRRIHRSPVNPLTKVSDAELWCFCSGSLEPESSCHDRDWMMELPMEADILTFTGILTPEDASVRLVPLWYHDQPKLVPSPEYASITLRYTIGDGKLPTVRAVTLVTLKIQLYPDGYQICILRVTVGGYRITAW